MESLPRVTSRDDLGPEYQDTPISLLLEYHNLNRPLDSYSNAELLIGMCMENRIRLRLPENFAYTIRAGGTILRFSEFKQSSAIAVG